MQQETPLFDPRFRKRNALLTAPEAGSTRQSPSKSSDPMPESSFDAVLRILCYGCYIVPFALLGRTTASTPQFCSQSHQNGSVAH